MPRPKRDPFHDAQIAPARAAARDIRPGDQVYLVPKLPTAPGIAYKRPRVTVVSIRPGVAVVTLANGDEFEVHPHNLVHRLPPPATQTETATQASNRPGARRRNAAVVIFDWRKLKAGPLRPCRYCGPSRLHA